MKIFIVILLVALTNSQSNNSLEKVNFNVLSKLKILQNGTDLKNIQKSIILQRNYECLNREYFELEHLREHEKNSELTGGKDLEFELEKTCHDYDSLKRMLKSMNKTDDARTISQIIINQLFNEGCDLCSSEIEVKDKKNELKVWLYAIISTSAITLSSFCGAFLIPFTKHKYYKRILMFLISLAIGTLGGTGFIHLIPQAFGINEDINYSYRHNYLWKCLVISAGLYLFFIVEQFLHFFIQFRKHKKNQIDKSKAIMDKKMVDEKNECNEFVYQNEEDNLSKKLAKSPIGSVAQEINKAHLNQSELDHTIAPVAWIIIFGEGLHNLIDGLSIGAAFTDSILNGLSISLAIICEEFPHKLGDFAILIAAGMPLKVALFCNFLSSCFIYIGLLLGIFAGENLDVNKWIYAVAGGMFVYIAVCDMIPELSEMSNEIEKEVFENESKNLDTGLHGQKEKFAFKIKFINFLIQNCGILIGYVFMMLIALYGEKIQL